MFKRRRFSKILILILTIISFGIAEVSVDFSNYDTIAKPDMFPQFKNSTATSWIVGGWRFYTDLYQWNRAWGPPNNISNTPTLGIIEHELLLTDPSQSMLQPGGISNGLNAFSYAAPNWQDSPEIPYGTHIFLKTGAIGKPDDPVDEDPITIDQIDSLINLPDFYNSAYRYSYIDSLGTNGGLYSGGFMGTFLGETQAIVPIPKDTFHINNDVLFDPDVMGGPIYMMTIAMMQEYFNVDMQWMFMTGAKETNAALKGVNGITVNYEAINPAAGYGPFEVETPTGVSRAVAYPKFFPEYSDSLGKYSWDQTTFIGAYGEQLMSDYCHPTFTGANSSYLVGSSVLSGLCYYFVYDILAYSADVCWLETLESSVDPYLGLAAMMQGYNQGINSGGGFPGLMKNPSYLSLITDPNASSNFSAYNNYFADVLEMLTALFKASDLSRTDNTIAIWNDNITLDDLKIFFLGEGGTVQTQGGGGLFKHFILNRVQTWNKIETAYNLLKGNAPGTTAETISFRYDFLTLLRAIKGDMDFNRGRVVGSEAIDWIKKHSGTGGCSGTEIDNKYPYGDALTPDYTTDFIVDIVCKDDVGIKEVKYAIDSAWSNWGLGVYKEGDAKNPTYTITIPKSDITSIYGDGIGTMWFMVTDESGNSIVKHLQIKGSPLNEAAAIDTKGDGKADRINVHITEEALLPESGDTANSPTQFNYSWPNQTPLSSVDNPVYSNGLFTFTPINDNGAGLGKVEILYPSMQQVSSRNIVDSVGPAIIAGSAQYKVPANNSEQDTLTLQFSEIIDPISGIELFLTFKKENTFDSIPLSANTISGTDQNWTFLFDYNLIAGYDSVKIVSTSSLSDTVNNSAEVYNQWVAFKEIGQSDPQWEIAYMNDKNGNGDGDEITIKIKQGTGSSAYTVSNITEINYSWPSGNYNTTITTLPTPINDETLIITPPTEISESGEGKISLTFSKDSKTYTISDQPIFDSVGTVIDSAGYYEKNIGDQTNDTLHVVLSEPLKSSLSYYTEYINLKTDNGDVTKTEVIAAINSSGNNWLFILAPKSIGSNDSVNLALGTDLMDLYDNTPQSNNQYVPINKVGGKIPAVDRAFIIDNNGDGIGDEIKVSIIQGNSEYSYTLDNCDSLKFIWPDGNPINKYSGTLSGTNLSITSDIDPASTGVGKVFLYFKDSEVIEVTDTIHDSIGPVINSALYYEKSPGDTSFDTLHLVLSEPITSPLTDNTEYINLKDDADVVTKTNVISAINTSGTSWIFILASGSVGDNDSVNFTTDSDLKDLYTNSPQNNNQYVLITKLGGKEPLLNNAYILDNNGDGIGDEIKFSIIKGGAEGAFDLSNCDSLKFKWPNANPLKTASETFSGIEGSITSNIDNSGHGIGSIFLYFNDNKTVEIAGSIIDSIGPAVNYAEYNFKDIGDISPDTLLIQITEPIASPLSDSTSYINLKNNNETVSTESFKAINTLDNYWIFILPNGTVANYDSVNLITNSGLLDNYGNYPQSNNQWVKIIKTGGKKPSIENAFIKDSDGDGYGDQIYFTILKGLSDSAFTLDHCDSLKFKWPNSGTEKTIYSGLTGLSDTISENIDDAGCGTGTMNIFFTDDSAISVQSSIIDSIGPAIQNAYYKEYFNQPCSLVIVFTEPIEENLLNNTAYLNIKKSNNSITEIQSDTAYSISSDFQTWTFILPPNSIEKGDSVNLISNSGLIDQAFAQDDSNNKPHPNNKMVKILVESEIYNIVAEKSSYWDADANGIMDSVILYLSKPGITDSMLNLMTFLIEWPDVNGSNITMLARGSSFNISGQSISWRVSNYALQEDMTTITDSSNYGGVTIIQPKDDSLGSIDTSNAVTGIQDKMAPVLTSAQYYINKTGDNIDTLIITFSEDIVEPITSINPFIFNENEYQIDLTVSNPSPWISIDSFIFTNNTSIVPKDGDSLNINVSADIEGSIIQSNSLNKHITLEVYNEILFTDVTYFDTDNRPDGRIDLIKVLTDTIVPDELLSALADNIILPSYRNFNSISSSDIIALNNENGFEIHVSQNLAFNDLGWSLVSTSVTTDDTIRVTDKIINGKFMLRPANYQAIDSLAPVITKGILMPAIINESNYLENVPDTVMVNFSEKINSINNDEPFNFIINGTSVAMTLSDSGLTPTGNTYRFIIVDNKDQVIMENDSVQIDDNSEISDINGNVQDKNTYPVPFVIGDYKYAYKLIVYPNPLSRSSEKQLQEKKEAFEQLGIPDNYATENAIAVMVRPYGYVLNSNDIETKITIFDMVGNRIVNSKKLEFQQTNSKQIWYYIWDTMNTKKRLVGNGVYLGQINMKYKDGTPQNIPPAKIGVGE